VSVSKYSAEFKVGIAKACLRGEESPRAMAAKHRISQSKLRHWVKRYEAHGAGCFSRKWRYFSAEFKLTVLQRRWADKLSFNETAAIFNIGQPLRVSRWERAYEQGGVEALKPRKIGRPKIVNDPKDKPPPERPDTERSQEELIAELNQLRMENAYLKKLDALVRARQAPKGRK
jgi:transposase